MDNILIFDKVNMSFYDLKKETKVLNDLSFKIKSGNIYTLIGPSGCGKSTILNLMANIYKPSSGTIIKPDNIGYMFQRDNLLDWLNILDNVLIGLKINKQLNIKMKEYAISLLNKYGLKEFIYSYPKELSGGMRQRVALIRAIILNPSLLLLDEPFSALDSQTRIEVSSDIYKIIKEFNITTVMVTHDISEAISFSDSIFILSNRPSSIKEAINIKFNDLDPYQRRNHPLFKDYFSQIWGEVNDTRTPKLFKED